MKRSRLTIPALALIAAMCFSSLTGCKGRSETASSSDIAASEISGGKSGNSSDANGADSMGTGSTGSSDSTEDTREDADAITSEPTTKTPLVLDGNVQLPDDAVIKGLTASIVGGHEIALSLRTDGKYYQADSTILMVGAQRYYAAYTISREYFDEMMKDADSKTSMTYDQYVDKMFEDGILKKDDFDENYNLKKLPDDRVFFSLSSQIDSEINRNSANFKEQISQVLQHSLETYFADPECYSGIEKTLKENKVVFDLPIFYNIQINMPMEDCIYIELEAVSLDGSRHYNVIESIMGTDKLADTTDKSMVLRHKTKDKNVVSSPVSGTSDMQKLNHDLQEFRSKCDVKLRFPDPWSRVDTDSLAYYRDPEYSFRVETGMLDGANYSYLGDGRWYYSSNLSKGEYLTVRDPADSERMLEECYDLLSSLVLTTRDDSNPVLRNRWKQDPSKSYTTSRFQPQSPTPNCSCILTNNTGESHKTFYFEMDGNDLLYSEATSTLQIAASGNTPALYNDTEFYEYIRVGKESFYRNDTTDVYYPGGEFKGTREPEMFEIMLQKNYTFVGGCELEMTPNKELGYNESQLQGFCCETYKSNDSEEILKVILDNEGHPVGGWSFDGVDYTIYLSITERAQEEDLKDILEHARTHTKELADKKKEESHTPADEWRVKDALEDGFFDLSGDIKKGEVFDGSQVVLNYILHFQSHKPFYVKQYTYGNYRREEAEITFDSNKDFYESTTATYHNDTNDYDLSTAKIGDTIYMWGTNLKVISSSAEGYDINELFYRFPGALNPNLHAGCLEAYRGTLNGKEYIIEVWECKQETYTFFCDDEKILAVSYTQLNNPMCTYFRNFDTKAKSSLIKKPT